MIKEAIDKIVELATPVRFTVDGIEYASRGLARIAPPSAVTFGFSTLKGFVDYLEHAEPDALPKCRIHVASPYLVKLVGPLHETRRDRESFALASFDEDCGFKFGQKYQAEDFTIALSTLFDETPMREQLIRIVGNMTNEETIQSTDDGFGQSVGQKVGVTLASREKITNPFLLSPHRTFPEVSQPEVPFIFRVHQVGGAIPMPALYECDNGAWKLEAIKSIAEWLTEEIADRKLDFPVMA